MATTLEIVNGISQAMANTHDGALDEKGEPVETGFLRREEEVAITDRRLIDGFSVVMYGDHLCLKYHSEMRLKEVHDSSFETDMESMLKQCAGFLKKQYKSITGSGLSLSAVGDPDIMVQSTSRVRSWFFISFTRNVFGFFSFWEFIFPNRQPIFNGIIQAVLAFLLDCPSGIIHPANFIMLLSLDPRANSRGALNHNIRIADR